MNSTSLEEEFTKCCLVLDTGSSASMFSNECLLTNFGCTSRHLKKHTNGGEARANKIDVLCYLRMSMSAESIANMLSLSHEESRHRLVMCNENDLDVKVEIVSGTWMSFVLNKTGFYAHDVRGIESSIIVTPRPRLVTMLNNNLTIITLFKPQKKTPRGTCPPK